MSRDFQKITVEHSNSVINFNHKGNRGAKIWDRFLLIENKPAYHIGNVCGTCGFFFERMEGANKSFSIDEIRKNLQTGIVNLDSETVNKFKLILPKGNYFSAVLELNPYKVSLGKETDYFSNEQLESWKIDGFWNLLHYPKIEYYRSLTENISATERLFEFIVPMFPENWLDNKTVDFYKEQISEDKRPTAVAISILDVKEAADDDDDDSKFYAHWCLSHYLIDGHHKVFASSLLNKPVTLLSFLAIDQSIAGEDHLKSLFTFL